MRPYLGFIPGLILFFALVLWAPAARAGETKGSPPRFVKVPVLFVTDREHKGKTFGPNRKYVVECKHDPFYGTVFFQVPNEDRKVIGAQLAEQGWAAAPGKPPRFAEKSVVDAASPGLAKETFLKRVRLAVDAAPAPDLYVLVHGTNNTFEEACHKAARLAYHLERPVLVYSWPSVGSLLSYHVDEGNVEWSEEHFQQLIADLKAMRGNSAFTVTVVAHSLGNRLVTWAMPSLFASDLFKEIILICPDIDIETFKHYCLNYHDSRTRVVIYTSTKDRALPISQMLYGGYYRLGEGVDSFFSLVTRPNYMVDSAKNLILAPMSIFRKEEASVQSGAKTGASSSTDKPYRAIDFTEVDEGIIGHKIPFALIGSMCRTGKPGPGLSLTAEKAGQRSRLSRFMRWSFDLFPRQVGEQGFVEKVVRDPIQPSG